jgi:hypothetical protein
MPDEDGRYDDALDSIAFAYRQESRRIYELRFPLVELEDLDRSVVRLGDFLLVGDREIVVEQMYEDVATHALYIRCSLPRTVTMTIEGVYNAILETMGLSGSRHYPVRPPLFTGWPPLDGKIAVVIKNPGSSVINVANVVWDHVWRMAQEKVAEKLAMALQFAENGNVPAVRRELRALQEELGNDGIFGVTKLKEEPKP